MVPVTMHSTGSWLSPHMAFIDLSCMM
jgi:hypothetical protein